MDLKTQLIYNTRCACRPAAAPRGKTGKDSGMMPDKLATALKKLRAQAFERSDWAEPAIRRYHEAAKKRGTAAVAPLRGLYDWMFVPISLWPFNVQDLLETCLALVEKGRPPGPRLRLILGLLPAPPDESICAAVTAHELQVQKGSYESQIKTQAKYHQNELIVRNDPELRRQWATIKSTFDVRRYQDHKGVIRRTMAVERNLRPAFSVDLRRQQNAFQAVFDAFCLRWHLYGMQHDQPLLLKLAVNLTPYGTMIHIPAYWSFDPKRDIRWDAIAKLHRTRVPGRQGAAIAEGKAERMRKAATLRRLDAEVRRRGLKGERKHEFICAGLGWDARTDRKRIARLRAEFKNRRAE